MSARIISTVGRAIDVIVAGRVVSHLRFAAGVCVLAAALLMGGAGGAVAVADPDSSGSAAHGDAGTTASGRQPSTGAKGPKKRLAGRTAKTARLARPATRPAAFRRERPEESARRDGQRRRHAWLGPATRPAAFRRERPEESARRDGQRRRHAWLGPATRPAAFRRERPEESRSERGRTGSHRGGAGYHCGGTGSHCGGAGY